VSMHLKEAYGCISHPCLVNYVGEPVEQQTAFLIKAEIGLARPAATLHDQGQRWRGRHEGPGVHA